MWHVCKSPSITLHNICISPNDLSPLETPAFWLIGMPTRSRHPDVASRLPGKKRIKHTRLGRKMEVVKKWLSRVYIHIWVYDIYNIYIYIFFPNIYTYIPLLYIHVMLTYKYLHICPQVPSEVCLFQGIPKERGGKTKLEASYISSIYCSYHPFFLQVLI